MTQHLFDKFAAQSQKESAHREKAGPADVSFSQCRRFKCLDLCLSQCLPSLFRYITEKILQAMLVPGIDQKNRYVRFINLKLYTGVNKYDQRPHLNIRGNRL